MILNTAADAILFKSIMLKQASFVDTELLIYWFILLPWYFRTCIKTMNSKIWYSKRFLMP